MKFQFASAAVGHGLLAIMMVAGCAAQTPSGTTVAAAPEQPRITVKYEPVTRVTPVPQINDLYLRLVAVPPSDADLNTTIFNQQKFADQLWKAAKQLVYKKDEVVLAAMSGKITGQDFGKRSLILVNPAEPSKPTYSDHYLTPYFRTSDALELQWITGDSIKTEQKAVTALVGTLGVLSAVYAPQGALFKAITNTSNISDKTKAVDAELNKVFSSEELQTKPLFTVDPAATERFDVYFNEKKMAIIEIDFRESLISPTGKADSMPNRSAEILGKRIEGVGPLSGVLARQPEAMTALNRNSAAGFAEFCRAGAVALSGAGFNVVDRSAILYAHLVDSQWNSAAEMRNGDDCEREIGYGSTGSTLPFKSTAELIAFREDGRKKVIAAMNKDGGIWNKLSASLGRPTADVWDTIAGDAIVLTSVKYDLAVAGGEPLTAGIPQTLSSEEAREFFLQAQMKFDKDRAIQDAAITTSCYSAEATATSSFRGYCFYPGASAKPITIEFDFTAPFSTSGPDPKLKSIKFLPGRAGLSL